MENLKDGRLWASSCMLMEAGVSKQPPLAGQWSPAWHSLSLQHPVILLTLRSSVSYHFPLFYCGFSHGRIKSFLYCGQSRGNVNERWTVNSKKMRGDIFGKTNNFHLFFSFVECVFELKACNMLIHLKKLYALLL